MNRISFLKRLLATLFGAAIAKPSLQAQARTLRHSNRTEESGHTEPVEVRYLLSATVAGTHYYDFPEVGPQLLEPHPSHLECHPEPGRRVEPTERNSHLECHPEPGRRVEPIEHPATLVLEPDNEFDFRAIEVWWKNGSAEGLEVHKMGYIPRKDNKVLYNLMKDGHQLQAFIRVCHANVGDELIYVSDFQSAYILRIRVYLPASS